MTARLAAFAAALLTATGVAHSAELQPTSGHSIHLASFDGSLYYTEEAEGFRVVATLASGSESTPIRFTATLAPEQQIVFSVPRSAGETPIDLAVVRHGDVLMVSEPDSIATEVAVTN